MKTSTLMKSTAAVVFVIAGVVGTILGAHDALAQGPFGPGGHGMMHDGSHLARVAAHINAAANTTPDQKARIDALVAQASSDLQALHAQAAQGHEQLHALLAQDRVDRTALENLRLVEMRLADQGSLRLTQLIGDVADVLTPEQRRTVVAQAQRIHGSH